MDALATNKRALRQYVEALRSAHGRGAAAVDTFFAPNAAVHIVHPFNDLTGPTAYQTRFLDPLLSSFDTLIRTDYIAFGGTYEDGDWVTCTGYYSGHFARPWLGIAPTGALSHLRFGEFHRMQDGQAVESYIFLDLPELMIAAGQWPIRQSPGRHRGYAGYLPGPITQDGLQWQINDPGRSAASASLVTQMLRNLATPDEAWRPYWHENMLWYGPAAFGSFVGLEEFAGFQVPFEQTFSEWVGGAAPGSMTRHFARFGDGDYVCSGGWPSLNAVQAGPFLGQPSDGKRLFMRVCDWWRRDGDLLAENWVFVDIPHVLSQMGRDIFDSLET
jgi:hypothetical protein